MNRWAMEADTWAMEASGLRSVDGSRPEGVWDCTCADTFAGIHMNRWAMEITMNNPVLRNYFQKCIT